MTDEDLRNAVASDTEMRESIREAGKKMSEAMGGSEYPSLRDTVNMKMPGGMLYGSEWDTTLRKLDNLLRDAQDPALAHELDGLLRVMAANAQSALQMSAEYETELSKTKQDIAAMRRVLGIR